MSRETDAGQNSYRVDELKSLRSYWKIPPLFRIHSHLPAPDLGECTGHNAPAFPNRNDVVDGHIRKPVYLAARPRNREVVNALVRAQSKMNARIGSGHVAHAAFCLFYLAEPT